MSQFDFDLITLGAGSGGVRASRQAAGFGAKVAVVEKQSLGGTCVNVGCVPKKLMTYAAHYREDFEDARFFGWEVSHSPFDWPGFIQRKNTEISRLNQVYAGLLEQSGVELLEGVARLTGPHEIEVGGHSVSARHILIATGSWPFMPAIPGIEYAISSNEAFYLPELPPKILILGGGYIAVEFAGIFAGMGSQVTLVHRGDSLLRGFDAELSAALAEHMRSQGLDLRLNCNLTQLERYGDGLLAHLSDGSQLEVDQVMAATGRKPNTAGLGLAEIGVTTSERGAVVVDEYFRSNLPHICAIGDVIDRMALTPVAIHEGMAVARTLFNDQPTCLDYANIPTAVFSNPQIGTVGLSEAKARECFGEVDVYVSRFRPMKHTLTGRPGQALLKLLVEPHTDRVLGCHMLGPDAAEIAQGLGIALKCGATKAQFDATLGIHPTSAEEFVTMRSKRV